MSNYLLIAGGNAFSSEQHCLSSCEISKGVQGFSSNGFTMKERRRGAAIFPLDLDAVVIVGGCSQPNTHLSSCETIKLKSDSIMFSDVIYFDEPGFSCAAYCKIKPNVNVIAGGYNGFESLNSMRLFMTDPLPKYINLKPLNTRLKNATAVPFDDDSLLLFGGWDESRTLHTIFSYNLLKEHLSFYGTMVAPIEGHSTTRIDNIVYIIGGYNGISVVANIIRYNILEKSSIQLVTKLKIARENHAASTIENDRILIVAGGWDGHMALKSCELFEILQEPPYLQPLDKVIELNENRNKPVIISI